MSEEDPKEELYRELLEETRESIEVVKKLMKSDNEDIRLEAVRQFMSLTDIAVGLADMIGEKPEPKRRDDKNPLARRTRA
jgi:hypothetical protein